MKYLVGYIACAFIAGLLMARAERHRGWDAVKQTLMNAGFMASAPVLLAGFWNGEDR